MGGEKKVHLRGFYGGSSARDRDAVTCRLCLAKFGETLFERRVARAQERR